MIRPKFLLLNFVISFFMFSCASANIIKLGEQVSREGIKVSEKALEVYALIDSQAEIEKEFKDKEKILTNPDPSSMKLPDTKLNSFSKQLEPRVKAYQALLKTYYAFSQLVNGGKIEDTVAALKDSYSSIETLPEIPEEVSSKLPAASKTIFQIYNAKEIKKHNQILYELTALFLILWEKDCKIWTEYIDNMYNGYADALNSVDPKRYDTEKILSNSQAPYDNATALMMYRLEQRNEIIRQRDAVKKQLTDFGTALRKLNKAHKEMTEDRTNIVNVTNTLTLIEGLIK